MGDVTLIWCFKGFCYISKPRIHPYRNMTIESNSDCCTGTNGKALCQTPDGWKKVKFLQPFCGLTCCYRTFAAFLCLLRMTGQVQWPGKQIRYGKDLSGCDIFTKMHICRIFPFLWLHGTWNFVPRCAKPGGSHPEALSFAPCSFHMRKKKWPDCQPFPAGC